MPLFYSTGCTVSNTSKVRYPFYILLQKIHYDEDLGKGHSLQPRIPRSLTEILQMNVLSMLQVNLSLDPNPWPPIENVCKNLCASGKRGL